MIWKIYWVAEQILLLDALETRIGTRINFNSMENFALTADFALQEIYAIAPKCGFQPSSWVLRDLLHKNSCALYIRL